MNENDKNKEKDAQDQTGAQGASGDNKDDGGSKQEGQQQTGEGNQEKTFTQKQVSQMMAREKKQGRDSVYKELGINPEDAKMLAMVKALVDSTKTDEQRAQEQTARANAEKAQAEQRAMLAEAKAEAMSLGAQPQFVEDVVTLAISKMSADTDLKTVIGELKTKYPVWFTQTEGEGENGGSNAVGQRGTGSSLKGSAANKGGSDGATGLGKRLAAQRRSAAGKKSSFWNN